MSSEDPQVAALLRQGLDAYGRDDTDEALALWQQVLALDPANAEALDYISSAERDDSDSAASEVAPEDAWRDVVNLALQRLDESDGSAALAALDEVAEATLEIEAVRDLVRARLLSRYSREISPTDLPVVRRDVGAPEASMPAGAGFVLSLIDGRTPVADLLSLSGMDRFDALHTLRGLVASGLVEFER